MIRSVVPKSTFELMHTQLTQKNFKKQAKQGLFLFILILFNTQFYRKKTVGFSQIRTRIVRVEGKHADHLTTITAQRKKTWTVKLTERPSNPAVHLLKCFMAWCTQAGRQVPVRPDFIRSCCISLSASTFCLSNRNKKLLSKAPSR